MNLHLKKMIPVKIETERKNEINSLSLLGQSCDERTKNRLPAMMTNNPTMDSWFQQEKEEIPVRS